VRIALDTKTHQARLSAVYAHPSPLLSVSQGNMQTLSSGNVVVDYGAIPDIAEYAPGGSLLFDAHLPFDMDNYRGFRFPWHGHPLSAPAVGANLNNTGEQTLVHASWNGATDVASWRVLAGESPQALKARSTIPASTFEASTILPEKSRYVAVQALDSSGRVLATSIATAVTSYAASLEGGASAG
jgi:hypothetical protein